MAFETEISREMKGENTMEKRLRVFHANSRILLWRPKVNFKHLTLSGWLPMILITQIVHKIGLLQILPVNYTFILVTLKIQFRLSLKRFIPLFLCSVPPFLGKN